MMSPVSRGFGVSKLDEALLKTWATACADPNDTLSTAHTFFSRRQKWALSLGPLLVTNPETDTLNPKPEAP